ncbi:cell division protein ZapA [Qipengyuania flava]|nr:cell division protein ZapA [Qipengyuania flava]
MSDVRLEVGGRRYTIACADGQEDSVRHLASMVDSKLAQMGANLSNNEAKNLLFAAILLADELDEANKRVAAPAPPPNVEIDISSVAEKLESLAATLENAASRLEG